MYYWSIVLWNIRYYENLSNYYSHYDNSCFIMLSHQQHITMQIRYNVFNGKTVYGNRVWSRTVSRPVSVSGACLAIYEQESVFSWSSILLDGYKKHSLPHQRSCEDLLVRRPKSVKTIDSTVWLRAGTLPKDISMLYIYPLSYSLFHFCFSFYNQFLLCVSFCLLACVFDSVYW